MRAIDARLSPAGTVAGVVGVTVRIEAVDTAANRVTVTGPAGRTCTIDVVEPSMRAFLRMQEGGDRAEVT